MGIRMNKAVGWGLDLSSMDKTVLDDFECLKDPKRFERFKAETMAYAEKHDDPMEKMVFHESMNPATDLFSMIKYDPEFGFEHKALLLPITETNRWHRYGDLLDVFEYEATRDYDGPNWMEPEWTEKPGTLYPYVGLMRANPDKPYGIEEYWEPCFMDREETRNAIPKAPRHLYFLIKHLELVPEDMLSLTFLSLRPTIYIWFS